MTNQPRTLLTPSPASSSPLTPSTSSPPPARPKSPPQSDLSSTSSIRHHYPAPQPPLPPPHSLQKPHATSFQPSNPSSP
ncbi:actin cytoskeleton organization protein (Cro1) [Histoplasma ohiense]|nr:actin cytoskeleton organization protein (Cro1) [Histoplasma ohiense (nom. inval.)]